MAGRQKPGIAPLGWGAFGKESLEGPKVHHDDHGPDDSVPAKGTARAIPGQQWEKEYNPLPAGTKSYADAFNPRMADERPCTHTKVNREDH